MTPAEPQLPEASELLALVVGLVAELRPGAPPPAADLDASLERGYGLDSLSRVELLLRIEQHWGVELPEGVLASA
ncbi:MAG TPA: acyl carrier protein, partial [Gammaproteobacteria bacterium]